MLTDEETLLRERLLKKLKPPFNRLRRTGSGGQDKSRGCNKKRLTKKEAETILNYIRRKDKRNKRRKETRFYHCPICNTYHLTSKK